MGLFGGDESEPPVIDGELLVGADASTFQGIDFAKYNLDGLSDDIKSIIDIPGAIARVAKWAFVTPVLVGILTWVVFSPRMSGIGTFFFSFGAVILSIMAAVVLGGFAVARQRLDIASQATTRVVNVVGEVHSDVVELKEGASSTTVRQMAVGITQHAILPVVFGVAEASAGPLARLGSSGSLMRVVEKSVVNAVSRLPDHEIGSMVDEGAGLASDTASMLGRLDDEYQRVVGNVEGVVQSVSRATLGSLLTFAGISLIPLVLYLIAGWALT